MTEHPKLLQESDAGDVYGYNGYLFIVCGSLMFWNCGSISRPKDLSLSLSTAPLIPPEICYRSFTLRGLLNKITEKIDADNAYWTPLAIAVERNEASAQSREPAA